MILALLLLAQVLTAPQAYTTGDPLELVTAGGHYAIELGEGCDQIIAGMNVEVLPGSGGVGAIAPIGSDVVCNVLIEGQLSDVPCAQTDGVCDWNAENQ